MLSELKGQIERISYTNRENGFTIAKVKVPGRQDLVCAAGNLKGRCLRSKPPNAAMEGGATDAVIPDCRMRRCGSEKIMSESIILS
jgi:hypothetical protein